MVREGYIEKIIYRNDDNGYSVFTVETTEGEEVFVGNMASGNEGMYIIATGEFVHHPQYDIQFRFTEYEIKLPDDADGIERYLGSGIIKGIGEVTAKRIVQKFGTDTLRIMEEEPERLAEIKGISLNKAQKIAVSFSENREFQNVIIFLSQYNISINLAMKIFNEYGEGVYGIISRNPYQIAEDIPGVGFRTADDIARKVGIPEDSEFRVRSAILYVLSQAMSYGHMFLPKEMLIGSVRELLAFYPEQPDDVIIEQLEDLVAENAAIIEEYTEKYKIRKEMSDASFSVEEDAGSYVYENRMCEAVYSSMNYGVEKSSAKMLADLMLRHEIPHEEINEYIDRIEEKQDIYLAPEQKKAVINAVSSGVAIITGGPGTGKTTIINVIIEYFRNNGLEIKLSAPTGRAAKRITESTGFKAYTIHRMLEFVGEPGADEGRGLKFNRNKANPIEADAIIVDEASMIDSMLFRALLTAISYGTRLILVGDTDQLPPVGAGNVLRDMIDSGHFPVTELVKIFRQDEKSMIVQNAHMIKNGEHIVIDNKNSDFFFIPRRTPSEILGEIETLITKNLPDYLGVQPSEIEVLSPMRKYELGVENLNRKLQGALNPAEKGKAEKTKGDIIFRVGDKVMQIRNNYRLEWDIYNDKGGLDESGIGVFNGDTGVITSIDDFEEVVTVTFDDKRVVEYPYSMLDELEHAFAVTVHKSQGSEYPAVIIPLYSGPPRLLSRNLIYTAVTRAKNMVVLVGNLGLINQMIDNASELARYTGFRRRLDEVFEVLD